MSSTSGGTNIEVFLLFCWLWSDAYFLLMAFYLSPFSLFSNGQEELTIKHLQKLVKIAGARRENYPVCLGCGRNIVCKCQKLRKTEMKSDGDETSGVRLKRHSFFYTKLYELVKYYI